MNIWLTLKSVDLMNAITISCLDHWEEKKKKKERKTYFSPWTKLPVKLSVQKISSCSRNVWTFAVRERRQNDSLTESELPFLSPSSPLPPHYSPHALLALLNVSFLLKAENKWWIAASYLATLPQSSVLSNWINPVFSCSGEVWDLHVMVSAVWCSHSASVCYNPGKARLA